MVNTMGCDKALDVLIDIASRWAENAEEAFYRRVDANDTDEECAEIAKGSGELFDDVDDVILVRDVWRAIELANHIRRQRGCETWDPAIDDGQLTTLMDVVIFG